MHLSQPQLAAKLAKASSQVEVGARYMHYKKQSYVLLQVALREEDSEPCAIYQAEYGERLVWIRPLSDWLGSVELDGKKIARFTKVT